VRILRKNEIQDAAELPMFRHTVERLEKLDNLFEMYKASPHAGYMIDSERKMISDFTQQGYSAGEIRMRIWKELGISRSTRAIRRYTKRLENGQL
jgi:hypothetical protein